RRVGFGAAVLLQCLPVSGRILADGLSESLFLLLAASALLWSARALRQPRAPGAFALAGLFGALAYLTRPGGAFLVAATGLVLLAGQAVPAWRRSRRDLLACGAALALAALLPAGPYVKTTGRLTVKPSALRVLEYRSAAAAGGGPALFAVWKVYDPSPAERVWWGVGVLAFEAARGALYGGWLGALPVLWPDRRPGAPTPAAGVV